MKHTDEAADRALISSMMPKDAGGALRVNPACGTSDAPSQIGVVPLSRTMRKPEAYESKKTTA
jgi:hypothetical protein